MGAGPVIAAAIHNGHCLRPEVESRMSIDSQHRLYEEDPYTGDLAGIAENRIIVHQSRFEVDLNRNRDMAVYLKPKDAWNLEIWKEPPTKMIVEQSLLNYDQFYRECLGYFKKIEQTYGRFVVLDIHSYCHLRNGPNHPPASQHDNPDINVGTATMRRRSDWANIIEQFMGDLGSRLCQGSLLDVRENIRFRGGWFPRWIHETFPETGCALAIEVKKIFMDEWTGKLNKSAFEEIKTALKSTLPGLLQELKQMGKQS